MTMKQFSKQTGKVFAARAELIEKIDITKNEIMFAGPVHRRDLQKHLKRMLAQLAQYDRLQAAVRREAG